MNGEQAIPLDNLKICQGLSIRHGMAIKLKHKNSTIYTISTS
jgi:hypothetical protein